MLQCESDTKRGRLFSSIVSQRRRTAFAQLQNITYTQTMEGESLATYRKTLHAMLHSSEKNNTPSKKVTFNKPVENGSIPTRNINSEFQDKIIKDKKIIKQLNRTIVEKNEEIDSLKKLEVQYNTRIKNLEKFIHDMKIVDMKKNDKILHLEKLLLLKENKLSSRNMFDNYRQDRELEEELEEEPEEEDFVNDFNTTTNSEMQNFDVDINLNTQQLLNLDLSKLQSILPSSSPSYTSPTDSPSSPSLCNSSVPVLGYRATTDSDLSDYMKL